MFGVLGEDKINTLLHVKICFHECEKTGCLK